MKYLVALFVLAGCAAQQVKVAPVKVEPIHLTIDVNVHDRTEPAKPR
jgi:hypothetical protein